MQTLKLKYKTSEDDIKSILNYMRQYSSVLHYVYNRNKEGKSQKEVKNLVKSLNNIELLDSWFIQCTFFDLPKGEKVIFGGKKNFEDYNKGLKTKEEFRHKRFSPIYSIGEVVNKSVKANRKFHIEEDLKRITFKPNAKTKIMLELEEVGKNRKHILKTLFEKQEQHEIKIAYKLSDEYVWVTFEEEKVEYHEHRHINNRVFAVDLNPNYIGWSVVDWKEDYKYKVIARGTYSIKELNDAYFKLKGASSDDPRKIKLTNKRHFEIYEIAKELVQTACKYSCSLFGIEDLSIESEDYGRGKNYNRLVNSFWCRNLIVNSLTKHCNINGIRLLEVRPEYSSFIGNIAYRKLGLPDMELSSIEIGRRAYEFYNQYIARVKEQKKNIVQPEIKGFSEAVSESLEEFGITERFESFKDMYHLFKKSKLKYRLPLDLNNAKVSRHNSYKSMIFIIT